MLGLGDVVIPGTFISLALRYDYFRSTNSSATTAVSPLKATGPVKYAKPYFYAALVSYFLGLGTTMGVMHTFGKAQPALLYLSPACILSFFITALVRGELKTAWAWSDDPEDATNASEEKATTVNVDTVGAPDKVSLEGEVTVNQDS